MLPREPRRYRSSGSGCPTGGRRTPDRSTATAAVPALHRASLAAHPAAAAPDRWREGPSTPLLLAPAAARGQGLAEAAGRVRRVTRVPLMARVPAPAWVPSVPRARVPRAGVPRVRVPRARVRVPRARVRVPRALARRAQGREQEWAARVARAGPASAAAPARCQRLLLREPPHSTAHPARPTAPGPQAS